MKLNKFIRDESGAITVDWVVLTASIVGIAIAVLLIIAGGIQSASTGVNGNLENTGDVSNGIVAMIEDDSGDNGGLPGNLNDYFHEPDSDHDHYTDTETGTRYRVQHGSNEMTAPNGDVVATVDGDTVTAV